MRTLELVTLESFNTLWRLEVNISCFLFYLFLVKKGNEKVKEVVQAVWQ